MMKTHDATCCLRFAFLLPLALCACGPTKKSAIPEVYRIDGGFLRCPVVDFHLHPGADVRELDKLIKVMDVYGIRIGVMASAGHPYFQSLDIPCFLAQARHPDRFMVLAGTDFSDFASPAWTEKHLANLRRTWELGSPGWSLQLGRPAWRMQLRAMLRQEPHIDDPKFIPVYQWLDHVQGITLIRIGEPDSKLAPGGIYFNPGWPDESTMQQEFKNILRQFPHIRFVASHMLGEPEQLDTVRAFLDQYPNLFINTAGLLDWDGIAWTGQRHTAVNKRHVQAWRDFFLQYQDRILFASGGGPRNKGARWTMERHHHLYGGLRKVLEGRTPFTTPVNGNNQPGLALPADVLEKIYYKNAMRILDLPDLRHHALQANPITLFEHAAAQAGRLTEGSEANQIVRAVIQKFALSIMHAHPAAPAVSRRQRKNDTL